MTWITGIRLQLRKKKHRASEHPNSLIRNQKPVVKILASHPKTPKVKKRKKHSWYVPKKPGALLSETPIDLAWKCEFDIPIPNTYDASDLSTVEAWTMLASSARKQRSEVRLGELSRQEKAEFEVAKQAEIDNWIKTGTISKILRDQIPHDQILRCRWILTWKPLDSTEITANSKNPKGKTHRAKARLVVLGYLGPKLDQIPRDSPTLGKTSRMLVLQTIASHQWELTSFDVKAAFLQGTPQKGRIIGIEPVPELQKAMNMQDHEVGILNKSAYGLIDAPYLWYKAFVEHLLQLGMETVPFWSMSFSVLREGPETNQPGALNGILGIHVDDGICAGNQKFQEVLQKIEAKYAFGSKKVQSFTFTGIDLCQHGDYSISLSQSSYVRKINPISIEPHRKTQTDAPVSEPERASLRGLIGSLQYAAVNTRPDLSSRLSQLQSSINSATIENLQEANRLLHEAKRHHDVTITIKSIPPKQFRFMGFSDASFASVKKPDSHAGLIIVGTHQNISENKQCVISPISWGSRKIQKVVTSTLSAETNALASAVDQLSWLRLFWEWLHNPKTPWKKPEEALTRIAPAISVATSPAEMDVAVTDCKSLFDLITRTAPPQCAEFRVALVARAIKDSLQEGIDLRWVSTGAQLADALTKVMESQFLRETLRLGTYKLTDESSLLRDRARTRDRVQWLKQQSNEKYPNENAVQSTKEK